MLDREAELIKNINMREKVDAIVVEGYDGVGKGKILELLSSYYGVVPYRPDYNLWQLFEVRQPERWKISGFFWDIYSHFNNQKSDDSIMLFDRGVISGAVYNNDFEIARHYKELLRDCKVLHILVTCSKEDYFKFMLSRNPESSQEDMELAYQRYCEYTMKYMEALVLAGVTFIIYENKYDSSDDRNSKCKSCGHYSHGWCRHPVHNCQVDGEGKRCSYANTKEVQDIDDEMYSMQS